MSIWLAPAPIVSTWFGGTAIQLGDASNTQSYVHGTAYYSSTNGLSFPMDQAGYNFPIFHRTRALVAFDLTAYPNTLIPSKAVFKLTLVDKHLHSDTSIEIYRMTKPFTQNANCQTYNGTNNWHGYMMDTNDYDSSVLDIQPVQMTASASDQVSFDVSTAVIQAIESGDKFARFMIKLPENRYTSAYINGEYVRFFDWYMHGWGDGVGYVETEQPSLTIEESLGLTTFYMANDDGTIGTTKVETGAVDMFRFGYLLPGTTSANKKFFVKNNLKGYLFDVRVWCDWARATVPQFSGAAAVQNTYISVINGDPGSGSPTTQSWQMTCVSGGITSTWHIQGDHNTLANFGSQNWYDMSPTYLTLSGSGTSGVGYYNSTANTEGIYFGVTAYDPSVGDKWTWKTFQNTSVPGAVYDSELYGEIAPDISNAPGAFRVLQPAHTTISAPISEANTTLYVDSVDRFHEGDRVIIHDKFNNRKQISTISLIAITGSVVITGGTLWPLVAGDVVYSEPLSVGDVASQGSKPFWLRLNVPDNTDTGNRTFRLQVSEGL